jgi:uncharacterized DUF497 family protein
MASFLREYARDLMLIEGIRIISARNATQREREHYEEKNGEAGSA